MLTRLPLPRLRGSYSHLHYGYISDALVDLTGGVVTRVGLHSYASDLLMTVKTAAKEGSLMTCATPNGVSQRGALCSIPVFSLPKCPAREGKGKGHGGACWGVLPRAPHLIPIALLLR